MKENLLLEWDYELNPGIDPVTVADQSNNKFYWMCPKGHPPYLMPMNKRYIGHGCPVCSNHKIIKGINDLTTTNPELMDEWCWKENEIAGIDPTKLSFGSNQKALWKCKTCRNTWEASISNRARIHSGCPYCAKDTHLGNLLTREQPTKPDAPTVMVRKSLQGSMIYRLSIPAWPQNGTLKRIIH